MSALTPWVGWMFRGGFELHSNADLTRFATKGGAHNCGMVDSGQLSDCGIVLKIKSLD